MKISLIVTTYNWPEALDRVLAGAARQTDLPDEIVIGDDGSGPATAELIRRWQAGSDIPIRHVWQEDQGFRAARIRNMAIAAASGDYLILLDGDMVPHHRFIEDHKHAATENVIIQGVRVRAGPDLSRRMLTPPYLFPGIFSRDMSDRKYRFRSRWLSHLKARPGAPFQRMASCNQGYWREQLIKVNGFDENMVGWGAEDNELAVRLLNAGYERRLLRYNAVAIHLYHESRAVVREGNPNYARLQAAIDNKLLRCEQGLDQHLPASRTLG